MLAFPLVKHAPTKERFGTTQKILNMNLKTCRSLESIGSKVIWSPVSALVQCIDCMTDSTSQGT